MKPLIIINFKNYRRAIGKKGLQLAKAIAKVKKPNYNIAIAPTLATTSEIAQKVKIPVLSQHINENSFGPHTGHISVEEMQLFGVKGTILNHSERKIPFDALKKIVEKCARRKFVTIVCASTLSEIKKVLTLRPDYIAYEPKELIGGNVSVTKANPNVIVKAVGLLSSQRKTKLLCGAGIHSREDVGQALVLGAHGVLLAHAVVQSKDPKKFLDKMLI